MPTVEIYEADKERLKSLRRETPDDPDRRVESIAKVVRRILDEKGVPHVKFPDTDVVPAGDKV